jgi:hypothetical protein
MNILCTCSGAIAEAKILNPLSNSLDINLFASESPKKPTLPTYCDRETSSGFGLV